jgi:hypothetical protein
MIYFILASIQKKFFTGLNIFHLFDNLKTKYKSKTKILNYIDNKCQLYSVKYYLKFLLINQKDFCKSLIKDGIVESN